MTVMAEADCSFPFLHPKRDGFGRLEGRSFLGSVEAGYTDRR